MSQSLLAGDASSGSYDVNTHSSSASSGSSGGDGGGSSGNGGQWWLTPQSEYVKLGAVDPAIFGLDISDVGGEPEGDEEQKAQAPTGSMFASPSVSAGAAKPKNFSEWMDDPLGRGKPTKTEPKTGPKTNDSSMHAPAKQSPKKGGATGAQGTGIASPRTFEMGDQVIGERSTKEFPIFNMDQNYEASVLTLQYSGHPSITIASRPDRLRPSHEGVPSPIVLAFKPTSEEAVSGLVTATLRWQMDRRPQEEIRIPVTGIAHHRGTQTHRQRQADAAETKQRAADADRAAKEQADIDVKVHDRFEKADLGEHQGHREHLQQLAEDYEAQIVRLYTQRQIGIGEAKTKISDYKRSVPPVVPSLISQLAWAALDSVSYGMASNVSGLLSAVLGKPGVDSTEDRRPAERPLEGPVRTVESTLPPALVTLVSQAVKSGLKNAGAAAIGAMKGTSKEPANSTANDRNAVSEFITAQSKMFYGDYAPIATKMKKDLYNLLMVTTFKTDPARALSAMEAAAAAISAEADSVSELQTQSTLQHWVNYLAQVSMGSSTADDGSSVIDMVPANHTAGEHPANVGYDNQPSLQKFDGLVDLAFVVNVARPEEPARLVSAKINGVNNAVADSLIVNGRLRPGVAVRAYGTSGGGNAVTPLTVVRDESGAITFTDHMGLEWDEASWLSKKAGQRRSTPEAQQEGARILLDELLSQQMPPVGRTASNGNANELHSLKTDSKD